MTSKEYWEELDDKAWDLEKRFRDERFISIEEHEYIVAKLIRQIEKWPSTTIKEMYEIGDQYKNIIVELEDREQMMSHVLKSHLNYMEDLEASKKNRELLMKEAAQFLHHKNDCRYIEKLECGRKVEVNESTDCSCHYITTKKMLETAEQVSESEKKTRQKLDDLRKDFFLRYDRPSYK